MKAIITTIWKRHELTEIVLNYYKGKGFLLIAAGSEGRESRLLVERVGGWIYIEVPNAPLTEKHNALLKKAKEYNVEGVILIGSDDLIGFEQLKKYKEFTAEETEYIGWRDCYFYDTQKKELKYFEGYGQSIGAGRYFSKAVLEAADWQLWTGKKNRSLDANCKKRLEGLGVRERVLDTSEIFDVKHEHNITDISRINLKTVNIEIMARKTSKKTVEKIEDLEPTEERVIVAPKKIGSGLTVEYLTDNSGVKKGTVKTLPIKLAEILIAKQIAKEI
jgi:hypothetical protein